ncbi:hypothetical protein KCP73_17250 [Salmonella enterica subsp. enterica]|nr:hypothetical protein KCP73_17250 [Salmonella enterica subsp. enterica]
MPAAVCYTDDNTKAPCHENYPACQAFPDYPDIFRPEVAGHGVQCQPAGQRGNLLHVGPPAFSREGMWRPVTIFSISGSRPAGTGTVSGQSCTGAKPDATRPSIRDNRHGTMLGLKDKIIHTWKPVTGIPDGNALELRLR